MVFVNVGSNAHSPLWKQPPVASQTTTRRSTPAAATRRSTMEASRERMPDVALDGDRLNMLLDVICADYITASYASRENAKRVFVKALQKLCLSVYAVVALPVDIQDADFMDKVRQYYEDTMQELSDSRERWERERGDPASASDALSMTSPSLRVLEDGLVKQVLKPKLVQFVEEMCKERDKQQQAMRGDGAIGLAPPRSGSLSRVDPATELMAAPAPTGEIRMEGYLRKKGQHVNLWRDRYFMIRSTPHGTHYLVYFRKKGDKDPRGWYILGPGTTVDEVRESHSKIETKKLFTFRISNMTHATADEVEDAAASSNVTASSSTMDTPAAPPLLMTPSRAVSTQEFPLSPEASASGEHDFDPKSILECIAQAEEQWKRYLNWYMDKDHDEASYVASQSIEQSRCLPSSTSSEDMRMLSHQDSSDGRVIPAPTVPVRARSGSFGSVPRSIAKTFRTSATFSQEASWKLFDFSSRIRVYIERSQQHSTKTGSPPPALRTSIKVLASPRKVFELLMKTNSSFYEHNHVIDEARVLEENTEDHSDVVYWKLAPTYLWPVHVEARDLCLLRYWRKEQDNSYFICFQSTTHPECPRSEDSKAVRASIMGGGFIISPRVHAEDNFEECWVTLTCQLNPKGWLDANLARSCFYMHAYGVHFLEMITCICATGLGQLPQPAPPQPQTFSASAVAPVSSSQLIVSEVEYPMLELFRTDMSVQHGLATKYWSEPCATTFLVRGPHYLSTRSKIPSPRQPFRLINAELYKANEPIRHIGLSSFVGAPLDSDAMVLIINFMLPGPPFHSLVLYFTPQDPVELRKNSVFADLCHEFLRGPNNDFRRNRFKLIPRVVQGTWSIREGVGTTPAILGTKLHQQYFQGRQYLEIDYDIGSSTVATGILKLLLGYSRDLIIDLGFVIEAQNQMELPERVLGCARLNCIDLRDAVQYVKPKEQATKV
ncbi:TPA: LOW QUALITY PROTEIN: hypothetical protein N0F65_010472 [Lagenidium giganteum]|uniref:START domain-containing protein n=1 Tax=Lagenidium giganteum TaxID=4803 RepID=A0AAV2YCV4_9STRA|nr:TPA: LOW QUALITY PROTEIN: hypothetical protein N0F65_010472 [Lagenidium giganteum]